MKNNKKEIKNRKRYFGNALTNAFFPVLASLGLTLGATCFTITTNSDSKGGEISKSHDIEIVPPSEQHPDWKLSSSSTKAKKGENVTFKANHNPTSNAVDRPKGIKINNKSTYNFDENLEVTVEIPFIEKMSVELVFPEEGEQHTVTIYLNNDPTGETGGESSTLVVQHNEKITRPNTPVRPGYRFINWFTEKASGEKFEFNNPITADTSIYAHWEELPEIIYHPISLDQPSGWSFTCVTPSGENKAKLGEIVTFNVSKTTSTTQAIPETLTLNERVYKLSKKDPSQDIYSVDVDIPFACDMHASVQFKSSHLCTVTFDTDGGSTVPAVQVEAGDTISEPTKKPTKTGYKDPVWYNGNDPFDFSTKITSNITLTAHWTIKSFTVIFYDEDGTTELDRVSTNFNEIPKYSKPNEPTKPATPEYTYKFAGWIPALKPVEDTGDEPTKYKADYNEIKNKYLLHFNSLGGTSVNSRSIEYGALAGEEPTSDKEGYTLKGWYTKDTSGMTEEEAATYKWNFATSVVEKETTLFARWDINTYTISFYDEDGKTLLKKEQTVYNNIPIYTGDIPTKKDPPPGKSFSFNGWENIKTGEKGLKPAKSNDEYKATFVEGISQHTVTYDSAGGTYVAPVIIEHNKPIVNAPTDPSKSGFKFDGWYYGDTKWVFGDSGTQVQGDITLTAHWNAVQYDIKFVNDDNTTIVDEQMVNEGSIPTLPTTTPTSTQTKEGQTATFAGWTPAFEIAKADKTYTATYTWSTAHYTVTFNADGGKEHFPSVTTTGAETIPDPGIPTKDGCTFLGWYNGETKWVFSDKVTSSMELKAKWQVASYTITFDPNNDGKEQPYTTTANYGETPQPTKIPAVPEKSGHEYTFIGWKQKDTSDMGLKPATADVTYVAQFSDQPHIMHAVTLKSTDGTIVETTILVGDGNKLPESCIPTKPSEDVEFGGWFKDAYFGQQWDMDNDVVTSDITLYVEWIPPYDKESSHYTVTSESGSNITVKYKGPETHFSIPSKIKIDSEEKTIVALASNAFLSAKDVVEVHLPTTIKTIGDSAFENCKSLTKINLNYISTFGVAAFYGCTALNCPIVMTSSVINMSPNLIFFNCNNIQSFQIVNVTGGQTKLTTGALTWRCESGKLNATYMEIPQLTSDSQIGENFFFYFTADLKVTFKGTIQQFISIPKASNWAYGTPISEITCSDGPCPIPY